MTLRPQTSLHLHRRRAHINMQLKYVLRVSVIPKGRNIITNCRLFKRLCWLASHQIRMHKRVISERNCFTFGLLLQRHIRSIHTSAQVRFSIQKNLKHGSRCRRSIRQFCLPFPTKNGRFLQPHTASAPLLESGHRVPSRFEHFATEKKRVT